MRCPHCGSDNANTAAVCGGCLRPLELLALEDRAPREPAEAQARLPAADPASPPKTVWLRVVAPESRAIVSSRLPDVIQPPTLHAMAPSMARGPARVPRLPRAPAPVEVVTEGPAPAELPAVGVYALREPARVAARAPATTPRPTEVLRPAAPGAIAALRRLALPGLRRPSTGRVVQPTLAAGPAAVPPLPRAVEPALREVPGPPGRIPRVEPVSTETQPAIRLPAALRRAAATSPPALPPAARPAMAASASPSPSARPAPLPALEEPTLREIPGPPGRVPPVSAPHAQEPAALPPAGAPRAAGADVPPPPPEAVRPPTPRSAPVAAAAQPAPVPSLVEPALREPARQPVQRAPVLARACERARQLVHVIPSRVRSLLSTLPEAIRPRRIRAAGPALAGRPAAVPPLLEAPAATVQDRLLREALAPPGRCPYVFASTAAGDVRTVPPTAASSVSSPMPEKLTNMPSRPVTLPMCARPARLPLLPPARTVRRPRRRPTRVRMRPAPMPLGLRPRQIVAILSVLVVSLAAITGYYVWRPLPYGGSQGSAATPGIASMAMVDGDAEDTYVTAVEDVWRNAMAELERFRTVVVRRNLRKKLGSADRT